MATKKIPDSEAPIKARVLVDGDFGKANAVITLPVAEAQAGQDAGELDTDPGAVAYAESLAAA